MQSRPGFALLAMACAATSLFCSPARADNDGTTAAAPPSADACADVALAKFKQWTQPRVQADQTNTYGDGSKKSRELIVTENAAYVQSGSIWVTGNITRAERGVASPEMLEKNMGLASCAKGDRVQQGGQSVTVYILHYQPDRDGISSLGTLWVSDATGLPLRQEFQLNGPVNHPRIATTMESSYIYNDDVTVPTSAKLADTVRRFREGGMLNGMVRW
jgi:hypothetical protein